MLIKGNTKNLPIVVSLFFIFISLASCDSSDETVYEDNDYDGIWDINDPYPGDTDNDGLINENDDDDDGDGYDDTVDAFLLDPREHLDTDGDGMGDNADGDDDNDGYEDALDAFPTDPLEHFDTDHDGTGDNADLDDDGDGVLDEYDLFPTDPTRAGDPDGDGVDTLADQDADGDGYAYAIEVEEGTNPFDPSSHPLDSDGDGLTDRQEILFGSDSNLVDTDGDGLGDLAEYALHTRPLSGDSDGDGLGDMEEAHPDSTHPPDFDLDGVIDALDFCLSFNFRTDVGEEILHNRFGITTDNVGNIYVANPLGNSIKVFGRDGGPLREIVAGFLLPNDISFASGFLFVTDSGNDRILKLDNSDRTVAIYEHQPDGTPGGFLSPRGINATQGSGIFVADTWNNRMQKYDGSWSAAGRLGRGDGEFTDPVDISVGPDGTIAVADKGNFRVQLFDRELRFIRALDGRSLGLDPFDFQPRSLVYAPNGRLYVLDAANTRIVIIDASGDLIGTFGQAGRGRNEFDNPTAVHVDANGKVYVSDRTRIQVF